MYVGTQVSDSRRPRKINNFGHDDEGELHVLCGVLLGKKGRWVCGFSFGIKEFVGGEKGKSSFS